MSNATVWNKHVLSDLPQAVLDEAVKARPLMVAMADACAHVESHDLLTVRIDVFRHSLNRLRVEAFPDKEYLGSYTPREHYVSACAECGSIYECAGKHPENGCHLGAVEDVLSL